MTFGFRCLSRGVLSCGVVLCASTSQAAESQTQQEESRRVSSFNDSFIDEQLDDQWSFIDPNGNDTISLDARPGWLRIRVSGPNEDMWENDRGGAPVLRRTIDDVDRDFSLQTYVDLASSNGGYPVMNSIGGLVVCAVGGSTDESPFLLTLGLQHNWDAGTEVILQKPGKSLQWASPGANAVYLRLDRDVANKCWNGYCKAHKDAPWILVASVADEDLPDGVDDDELGIGLFAKTWEDQLGGPASIDFAYFGEAEQQVADVLQPVRAVPVAVSREVKTGSLIPFCVSGKEMNVLNGYREAELLRHSGKGCLTHMWFGGDWPGYHQTRIRVYVDGEREPSIDMELGLGHGIGFGDDAAPWGGSKLGKTGHPSGFYNTYKIPYGNGIRVTAQRSQNGPERSAFWWIVRGTESLPVTLAGVRLPDNARLKLHRLNQHVAKPFEEFALCDVEGTGALYQVAMAADGQRDEGDWKDISYLEAIVRAYINGQDRAVLLSSGLEDYFLGTYYFNRGRYANDLAGLTHLDKDKNTFSGYRFHDEDPIFFQNGLRLTCRCGEVVGGKRLHDPPETEFTTYTWMYQW